MEFLKRFNRGFTLLEIIVVILILSIGLIIIVPQFSSGIFVNEKRLFLRRLYAAIHKARNIAMLKNTSVSLTFYLQTGKGGEYFLLSSSTQNRTKESKIDVPKSIDIINILNPNGRVQTSGKIKFIFLPNGLNSEGIINCSDGKNYFHITIKPFARMKIASGKVSL